MPQPEINRAESATSSLRRRTLMGTALRICGLGLVVACAVAVWVVVLGWPNAGSKRPSFQVPPFDVGPQKESFQTDRLRSEPNGASSPTVPEIRPPEAESHPKVDQLLESLEDGIVKIETGDADDVSGLGSGFIIDARGLVATSYHVLADSTAARARFKNGVAYEIAGYAAVQPDVDLAIVKLKSPPDNLRALRLSSQTDPARLSPVVAVGHPYGVEFSPFDGKVSRVLNTSELPGRSQRFLRQLISGRLDQRWIQHTAGIAAGNSGGPLLNDGGDVIGVNTWVDKDAGFGYALHASHLRTLQAELFPDVVPLERFAKQNARLAEMLRRLSPQRIEDLYARAKALRWRPVSDEDYEVLQQLAWAVTVVQLPRTFAADELEDRLDELVKVTDRIVADLHQATWTAPGQITFVNEHAASRISRPMEGVFFFATVERVVEGDDGARGALLQLAGEPRMLFIPLDDQLGVPSPGVQCLVLGVNYAGHTVRYGDNPLRPITAQVIATRTIIPLAK